MNSHDSLKPVELASSSLQDPSMTTWISQRATELGFLTSGVVRAEKFPELDRQEEWLARGYAGEMKYLSDARRGDPPKVMPGVRSVIVCALNYHSGFARTAVAPAGISGKVLNADATDAEGPRGWISRYAWGDDYHEVLYEKLESLLRGLRTRYEQQFEARIYVDTGPLHERVLAKHAGLGWLGKNTLLLNQEFGSYFFLGVILTTLDLAPSVGAAAAPPADRCGTCRKCLEACPTDAFVEPYVMDARKCISYLTIELRGPIPLELREPIGSHIFGCDICQDVCPWNRRAPHTLEREFQPRNYEKLESVIEADKALDPGTRFDISGDVRESLFWPRLEWLASLTQEQFSQMFRGSPIQRTKWRGLLRNVCVALGNSGATLDSAARGRVLILLERLARLDEPVLVESAQWAISRIQEVDREAARD
jgi:epoxyqueuosine reductase